MLFEHELMASATSGARPSTMMASTQAQPLSHLQGDDMGVQSELACLQNENSRLSSELAHAKARADQLQAKASEAEQRAAWLEAKLKQVKARQPNAVQQQKLILQFKQKLQDLTVPSALKSGKLLDSIGSSSSGGKSSPLPSLQLLTTQALEQNPSASLSPLPSSKLVISQELAASSQKQLLLDAPPSTRTSQQVRPDDDDCTSQPLARDQSTSKTSVSGFQRLHSLLHAFNGMDIHPPSDSSDSRGEDSCSQQTPASPPTQVDQQGEPKLQGSSSVSREDSAIQCATSSSSSSSLDLPSPYCVHNHVATFGSALDLPTLITSSSSSSKANSLPHVIITQDILSSCDSGPGPVRTCEDVNAAEEEGSDGDLDDGLGPICLPVPPVMFSSLQTSSVTGLRALVATRRSLAVQGSSLPAAAAACVRRRTLDDAPPAQPPCVQGLVAGEQSWVSEAGGGGEADAVCDDAEQEAGQDEHVSAAAAVQDDAEGFLMQLPDSCDESESECDSNKDDLAASQVVVVVDLAVPDTDSRADTGSRADTAVNSSTEQAAAALPTTINTGATCSTTDATPEAAGAATSTSAEGATSQGAVTSCTPPGQHTATSPTTSAVSDEVSAEPPGTVSELHSPAQGSRALSGGGAASQALTSPHGDQVMHVYSQASAASSAGSSAGPAQYALASGAAVVCITPVWQPDSSEDSSQPGAGSQAQQTASGDDGNSSSSTTSSSSSLSDGAGSDAGVCAGAGGTHISGTQSPGCAGADHSLQPPWSLSQLPSLITADAGLQCATPVTPFSQFLGSASSSPDSDAHSCSGSNSFSPHGATLETPVRAAAGLMGSGTTPGIKAHNSEPRLSQQGRLPCSTRRRTTHSLATSEASEFSLTASMLGPAMMAMLGAAASPHAGGRQCPALAMPATPTSQPAPDALAQEQSACSTAPEACPGDADPVAATSPAAEHLDDTPDLQVCADPELRAAEQPMLAERDPPAPDGHAAHEVGLADDECAYHSHVVVTPQGLHVARRSHQPGLTSTQGNSRRGLQGRSVVVGRLAAPRLSVQSLPLRQAAALGSTGSAQPTRTHTGSPTGGASSSRIPSFSRPHVSSSGVPRAPTLPATSPSHTTRSSGAPPTRLPHSPGAGSVCSQGSTASASGPANLQPQPSTASPGSLTMQTGVSGLRLRLSAARAELRDQQEASSALDVLLSGELSKRLEHESNQRQQLAKLQQQVSELELQVARLQEENQGLTADLAVKSMRIQEQERFMSRIHQQLRKLGPGPQTRCSLAATSMSFARRAGAQTVTQSVALTPGSAQPAALWSMPEDSERTLASLDLAVCSATEAQQAHGYEAKVLDMLNREVEGRKAYTQQLEGALQVAQQRLVSLQVASPGGKSPSPGRLSCDGAESDADDLASLHTPQAAEVEDEVQELLLEIQDRDSFIEALEEELEQQEGELEELATQCQLWEQAAQDAEQQLDALRLLSSQENSQLQAQCRELQARYLHALDKLSQLELTSNLRPAPEPGLLPAVHALDAAPPQPSPQAPAHFTPGRNAGGSSPQLDQAPMCSAGGSSGSEGPQHQHKPRSHRKPSSKGTWASRFLHPSGGVRLGKLLNRR